MAAAEVDGYRYNSYAKYSTAERAQMRAAFYAQYLEKEPVHCNPTPECTSA